MSLNQKRRDAALRRRIVESGVVGLSKIFASLRPAPSPEWKHPETFVRLIMDAAEQSDDARVIAKEFLARDPAYTNTNAGVAALQFEALLIEKLPAIYQRLIETQVEVGSVDFLSSFDGPLTDSELRQLIDGSAEFCTVSVLLRPGIVRRGYVSEWTVLKGLPVERALKVDIGKDIYKEPSLSPDDYQEARDGGLPHQIFCRLWGVPSNIYERLSAAQDSARVAWSDPNGVTWHGDGEMWFADDVFCGGANVKECGCGKGDVDDIIGKRPSEYTPEEAERSARHMAKTYTLAQLRRKQDVVNANIAAAYKGTRFGKGHDSKVLLDQQKLGDVYSRAVDIKAFPKDNKVKESVDECLTEVVKDHAMLGRKGGASEGKLYSENTVSLVSSFGTWQAVKDADGFAEFKELADRISADYQSLPEEGDMLLEQIVEESGVGFVEENRCMTPAIREDGSEGVKFVRDKTVRSRRNALVKYRSALRLEEREKGKGTAAPAQQGAARGAGDSVEEVSPPGFSGTIKAMQSRGINKPRAFALAWGMYRRGFRPRRKPESNPKGIKNYVLPSEYFSNGRTVESVLVCADGSALSGRVRFSGPSFPVGDSLNLGSTYPDDLCERLVSTQLGVTDNSDGVRNVVRDLCVSSGVMEDSVAVQLLLLPRHIFEVVGSVVSFIPVDVINFMPCGNGSEEGFGDKSMHANLFSGRGSALFEKNNLVVGPPLAASSDGLPFKNSGGFVPLSGVGGFDFSKVRNVVSVFVPDDRFPNFIHRFRPLFECWYDTHHGAASKCAKRPIYAVKVMGEMLGDVYNLTNREALIEEILQEVSSLNPVTQLVEVVRSIPGDNKKLFWNAEHGLAFCTVTGLSEHDTGALISAARSIPGVNHVDVRNDGEPDHGSGYAAVYPDTWKNEWNTEEAALSVDDPTLGKDRKKLMNDLYELGKTFPKTLPVNDIRDMVKKYGFDASEIDGIYTGKEGRDNVFIGRRTWLHWSWYKRESGSWEVTAYLSYGPKESVEEATLKNRKVEVGEWSIDYDPNRNSLIVHGPIDPFTFTFSVGKGGVESTGGDGSRFDDLPDQVRRVINDLVKREIALSKQRERQRGVRDAYASLGMKKTKYGGWE